MIFIKTKRYPAKGFNAITHWPFVFYKYDSPTMRRHEAIHGAQQKELGVLGLIIAMVLIIVFGFSPWLILSMALFYPIYGIEYLFKGYRGISFEKEAYKNERYILYKRKHFQQWR